MPWSLFEQVDRVLVEQESRQAYASRTPRVWPSEASAELISPDKNRIVGKCHRASFFRLIGVDAIQPVTAVSARRMRTGRAMEDDLKSLCQAAGIFVASGVRYHVSDIDMPLELDLVVLDPDGRLVIVENKTIYGYMAAKDVIQGGSPKMEHLLQAAIYANEFSTGLALKEAIYQCLKDMRDLESEISRLSDGDPKLEFLKSRLSRYRMEVDFDNLDRASNGPVSVKLAYETRDTCETREFDIALVREQDKCYVSVDGSIIRTFTVDSVYNRFYTLQRYYWQARLEAEKRLLEKGLVAEGADSLWFEESDTGWELLVKEMSQLGPDFWPPAEYEWRYPEHKIIMLGESGLIGKTTYAKWKKNPALRVGDWQCEYCSYKLKCVAVEYPEYAALIADLANSEENSPEGGGE